MAPAASNPQLTSVRPLWLVVSDTERYLLVEDTSTGDVLLPLIYMKHVFAANYSRKLSSLKHRLVPLPDGVAAALTARTGRRRGGSFLYWQWAFESPHEVKALVRQFLGQENALQGHLRLVLLPIVFNAMAQKAKLRQTPLFQHLHHHMRLSTYWPLLKHPPQEEDAARPPVSRLHSHVPQHLTQPAAAVPSSSSTSPRPDAPARNAIDALPLPLQHFHPGRSNEGEDSEDSEGEANTTLTGPAMLYEAAALTSSPGLFGGPQDILRSLEKYTMTYEDAEETDFSAKRNRGVVQAHETAAAAAAAAAQQAGRIDLSQVGQLRSLGNDLSMEVKRLKTVQELQIVQIQTELLTLKRWLVELFSLLAGQTAQGQSSGRVQGECSLSSQSMMPQTQLQLQLQQSQVVHSGMPESSFTRTGQHKLQDDAHLLQLGLQGRPAGLLAALTGNQQQHQQQQQRQPPPPPPPPQQQQQFSPQEQLHSFQALLSRNWGTDGLGLSQKTTTSSVAGGPSLSPFQMAFQQQQQPLQQSTHNSSFELSSGIGHNTLASLFGARSNTQDSSRVDDREPSADSDGGRSRHGPSSSRL